MLLVLVQVATAAVDCRKYMLNGYGWCEYTALASELVAGGGIQSQVTIRNTSNGNIQFEVGFYNEVGFTDISGRDSFIITTKFYTQPKPSNGWTEQLLPGGTMIVNVLSACKYSGSVCNPVDQVKTGSAFIRVSAPTADILDAQDDNASQLRFAYMPDGVTILWHVETSFVRESNAAPKWGFGITQTSADKLVSQTSSDNQFHIVNGDTTQSVLVEIMNGSTVVASVSTRVLLRGETYGTALLGLFGDNMFPTKNFSGDFTGEVRLTGMAGGKIVPWPKVVVAGFYPITLRTWVRR